jgi:hypothetical protein
LAFTLRAHTSAALKKMDQSRANQKNHLSFYLKENLIYTKYYGVPSQPFQRIGRGDFLCWHSVIYFLKNLPTTYQKAFPSNLYFPPYCWSERKANIQFVHKISCGLIKQITYFPFQTTFCSKTQCDKLQYHQIPLHLVCVLH